MSAPSSDSFQENENSIKDNTTSTRSILSSIVPISATISDHDVFVRKLALIASLSGLLFGYDTGVVSGAIIFIRSYMELSDLQVEIVVASTVLSAAFSALWGGSLLDSIGRKKTLVIASIIFVIGSLVMAISFGPKNGYAILILGRLIVGVAIGLAADAGPLYISECAPPKLRGSLTTLFNMAVVGGQVVASFVCGCLSYLPPSYNWRLMLAFGALPAIAQMLGFIVLPLSPTWLVLMGRKEEAEQVLRRIRMLPKEEHSSDNGEESEEEEDEVTRELNEIIEEHEQAQKGKHVGLWELWCSYPQIRRTMLLGCSLWIVSQLAGINTIMYYGAGIVQKTGVFEGDKSMDIWITVPLSLMQLIGIVVCFTIIDRFGRRPTLLMSMSFVFLSLMLIGTGFAMDASKLTVAAMFIYLFSFGLGLSTMPYTMNSEIYTEEYRGKCVAQATGVFWFSNFLVSVTFLTLANALGNEGIFYLYAAIVFVSEVFFYFLVPETSGLSLHEIQTLFIGPEGEHTSLGDGENNDEDYGSTNLELSLNTEIV
jgi:sugar porter (SP) family MFS transporter